MLSLHLHPEDTFEIIRICTYSQTDKVKQMVRFHCSFCQACAMWISLASHYAATLPLYLLQKSSRLICWIASLK